MGHSRQELTRHGAVSHPLGTREGLPQPWTESPAPNHIAAPARLLLSPHSEQPGRGPSTGRIRERRRREAEKEGITEEGGSGGRWSSRNWGPLGPREPIKRKDTSSEEALERSMGSQTCPCGPLYPSTPGPLLFLGRTWGAMRKSTEDRETQGNPENTSFDRGERQETWWSLAAGGRRGLTCGEAERQGELWREMLQEPGWGMSPGK